ncbi:monovalent cation/H(+) antiporter subunit G [Flindersiella endophytica]
MSQILLWAGVALMVFASLGTVVIRPLEDRLHVSVLLSAIGAPLVVVALLVDRGSSLPVFKLLLVLALLVLTGSAATVALARAGVRRSRR